MPLSSSFHIPSTIPLFTPFVTPSPSIPFSSHISSPYIIRPTHMAAVSVYLSLFTFVCLCLCLHLCLHPFICLSLCVCLYLSTRVSVHLCLALFLRLPIDQHLKPLSIYGCVCFLSCLPVRIVPCIRICIRCVCSSMTNVTVRLSVCLSC